MEKFGGYSLLSACLQAALSFSGKQAVRGKSSEARVWV